MSIDLKIMLLGLACAMLIPVTAGAQFVRFQVSTQSLSAIVDPEPLDFTEADSVSVVRERNDTGDVTALVTSACLRIGAAENIPLLVNVRIEDLRLREGRERPIDLEPRYINDTNPCPTDISLAREVSRPFRGDGTAEFQLSDRPETLSSQSRRTTALTAFIVLMGRQHLRPDAAIMDQRQDLDYQGRYLLDITYL